MLLVLEGADGTGKTTTCRSLKSLLEADKIKVAVFAYPCLDGTGTGDFLKSSYKDGNYLILQYKKFARLLEKFKSALLNRVLGTLSMQIEERKGKAWEDAFGQFFWNFVEGNNTERSLLFALNRYETKDKLEKLIKNNDVVILDRYIASNLAYNFEKWRFFHNLELDILKMPAPTLNLLLDTDVVLKSSEEDVYERSESVQSGVIQNYKELAGGKLLPDWDWEVVAVQNSSGKRKSKKEITQEVYKVIRKRLKKVGKSSSSK